MTPQEIAEIESEIIEQDLPKWLVNCPLCYDWCVYKGEIYFASLNWERSVKIKRPVFDLAYCATRALNGSFLTTKVWHPVKFQPWIGYSLWNHFTELNKSI